MPKLPLRKQIDKLLATQNSETGNDDEMRMLIDIVARRDSLFTPWRTPVSDTICQKYSAIKQRQTDYLSGVRGCTAKASGRNTWKDTHHTRNRLLARGWAIPTSSGGQVTSLLVSELGDAVAQSAISKNYSTVEDGLPVFGMLRRYGSLSESTLLQRELTGDVSAWAEFSELLLPLLVRGLVTAASDTQGRMFYAAGPGEPDPPPIVEQPVLDWAFDSYFKSFHAERIALESIKNEGGELWIPIPSGHAQMKTFQQLEEAIG